MKLRRAHVFSLLLLVLLFALLSAGCSQPGETEETTLPPETTASPEQTETAAAPQSGFSIPENIDLREIVADYMRQMGLVEWTPSENIDFSKALSITGDVVYNAGTTYRGMPYANRQCGLELFLNDLDEKNVYRGSTNYQKCTGNTCTTSIRNAWQLVSNKIDFKYAVDMLPYYKQTGVLALGDIPWDGYDEKNTTNSVLSKVDEQKVYEAYALLKTGDAVTRYLDSNGHARMVTGEVFVARNNNGTINSARSTAVLTEQTSHWAKDSDSRRKTHWNVDRSFSFGALYKDGYLPVTIAELQENKCDEPTFEISNKPIAKSFTTSKAFRGQVISNYKILSAVLSLTKDGQTVNSHTFYVEDRKFDMADYNAFCDISSLPSGAYTFTAKCKIGIGEYTVFTMDFTLKD